jgi:hypothetical protein
MGKVFNREYYERLDEIYTLVDSDPILRSSHHFYEMNREEKWVNGM